MAIAAPYPDLVPGESVAVDGACLTVERVVSDGFTVHLIATTLDRTRFADLPARATGQPGAGAPSGGPPGRTPRPGSRGRGRRDPAGHPAEGRPAAGHRGTPRGGPRFGPARLDYRGRRESHGQRDARALHNPDLPDSVYFTAYDLSRPASGGPRSIWKRIPSGSTSGLSWRSAKGDRVRYHRAGRRGPAQRQDHHRRGRRGP